MNPVSKNLLAALITLLVLAFSAHASYDSYTVKKNDNVSSIAKAHNTTVKELTALNGLSNAGFIQVGQKLKVPAQFSKYTIKKGDTLGAIAKSHSISLKTLTRANPEVDPRKLSIGQSIKVPLSDHFLAKPAYAVPILPYTVSRKLDRIPVKNSRWKYIVIHHSASKRGTIKGMDRYHREERHMVNGLAYHFVIGNGGGIPDGEIEVCHRWEGQLNGGHLASERLNQKSVGICLIGNFDKTAPSKKQLTSLEALLRYLKQRSGLSNSSIYTHRSINTKPTACPGKYFSMTKVQQALKL